MAGGLNKLKPVVDIGRDNADELTAKVKESSTGTCYFLSGHPALYAVCPDSQISETPVITVANRATGQGINISTNSGVGLYVVSQNVAGHFVGNFLVERGDLKVNNVSLINEIDNLKRSLETHKTESTFDIDNLQNEITSLQNDVKRLKNQLLSYPTMGTLSFERPPYEGSNKTIIKGQSFFDYGLLNLVIENITQQVKIHREVEADSNGDFSIDLKHEMSTITSGDSVKVTIEASPRCVLFVSHTIEK